MQGGQVFTTLVVLWLIYIHKSEIGEKRIALMYGLLYKIWYTHKLLSSKLIAYFDKQSRESFFLLARFNYSTIHCISDSLLKFRAHLYNFNSGFIKFFKHWLEGMSRKSQNCSVLYSPRWNTFERSWMTLCQ